MRNILISAEALSMTWADLSLLSSPFNSKWNPRAPISSIILHSLITGRLSRHYISQPSDHSPPSCKRLSAHCMRRYRDLKILICSWQWWIWLEIFGSPDWSMINWQRKQWMMILLIKESCGLVDGRRAEVIIMTVNDKTVSFELIVFRQNKKIEFMQR